MILLFVFSLDAEAGKPEAEVIGSVAEDSDEEIYASFSEIGRINISVFYHKAI